MGLFTLVLNPTLGTKPLSNTKESLSAASCLRALVARIKKAARFPERLLKLDYENY
jgi:hypothetical protein